MLRFLCCCCFSGDNSSNERRPLLHPKPISEGNEPVSVRQARPGYCDEQTMRRTGRLLMRRVNVPELDRRFSDMAETFNEQQEHYELVVRHIRNLQRSCSCPSIGILSFTECVRNIRDEHEAIYRVSLKMKGYDFSLDVVSVGMKSENMERPLPPTLLFAQNEIKGISESAKATVSKGTALQEVIGWLLRSQDQMAEQVKRSAETYQDQGRLKENLEENIREVKRAKELSQRYRQQAGDVLIEAAQIAGAHL